MIANSQKILIAEDKQALLRQVRSALNGQTPELVTARSGADALRKLQSREFSLFLMDLNLPDIPGLDFMVLVKERNAATETIVFTDRASVDRAVEAIQLGAYDYLEKPVAPARLRKVITKALNRKRTIGPQVRTTPEPRDTVRFGAIISQSDGMARVYELIDAVADSTANVIITGESGTGKELVARAIHEESGRADGPFVAVNCSAFPIEILENELFGHEQGAFTGALKEKHGCFELADHGTLFLDEVCDMPLEIQAKMLRVLEERSFRRLGGKKEIKVDVRVIAASNKKLEQAVEDGTLREDLYYRLCVVEIELPPLRHREGDLRILMDGFLALFTEKNRKDVAGFSPDCIKALRGYHWPGNVRELKNTIERAVVLARANTIALRDLPRRIVKPTNGSTTLHIPMGTSLEVSERELICKTLEFANNNKTRTAGILGISLKTLHNKLNHYRAQNLY